MKVHRCPHCSKPFLESEAPTGTCPVCQGVVWEVAKPESEPTSEAEDPSEPEAQADSKGTKKPETGRAAPLAPDHDLEPSASKVESAPRQTPHLPARQTPGQSEEQSPTRPRSLLFPTLIAAALGGVLWWIQVHRLQSQRDDLLERLELAEGTIADAEHRALEAEKIRQSTETSATQALTKALDRTDLGDRMRAALALIKIDPHHKLSQAMLLTGMRDDPAWISPVSELEPAPQWAIPTLIGLLRDPDADTRRFAAEALGRLRPGGPIAQAVLDTATRDRDARVRQAAELALKAIRDGNRPPMPSAP